MKIGVIGSGFAGITASAHLGKLGHDVTVFEKNNQAGGRARNFNDQGFLFDMGPSWYWMPEVFEGFFNDFDKTASDYYNLIRLDPSYRVFFKDEQIDVPAGKEGFLKMAEELDPGSARRVEKFLTEAQYKYQTSMNGFVQKPSLSIREYFSFVYLQKAWKMNMFSSIRRHVKDVTEESRLKSILEFPVLFLGETPSRIPSMYSMMNYADIELGTWYPMGGMHKIVEGFVSVAKDQGVKFELGVSVDKIESNNKRAEALSINGEIRHFDAIVSGADYAHTESLLKLDDRQYSEDYWKSRSFAPSCLLYFIGLNKKVDGLLHHNLFFDEDFDAHANEIYNTHSWPKEPLFYVSCPSKTDSSVAPSDGENLFILIPVSTKIEDSADIREKYFQMVLTRLKKHLGQGIEKDIVVKHTYARQDFINDYNAYGGNAYGLANTLKQTAFLKPRMRSSKLLNLYFTGQLTVPGPGVPPAIISGKTVAELVHQKQTL